MAICPGSLSGTANLHVRESYSVHRYMYVSSQQLHDLHRFQSAQTASHTPKAALLRPRRTRSTLLTWLIRCFLSGIARTDQRGGASMFDVGEGLVSMYLSWTSGGTAGQVHPPTVRMGFSTRNETPLREAAPIAWVVHGGDGRCLPVVCTCFSTMSTMYV